MIPLSKNTKVAAPIHTVNEEDKTENATTGIKHDADKARWDLLDYNFIKEGTEVLTFGATEYGPNSWKSVTNGSERYFAALMRHIVAWRQGEKVDPQTGKSHLAHALCNLMFLFGFEKNSEK